jgi:hypothetical protein
MAAEILSLSQALRQSLAVAQRPRSTCSNRLANRAAVRRTQERGMDSRVSATGRVKRSALSVAPTGPAPMSTARAATSLKRKGAAAAKHMNEYAFAGLVVIAITLLAIGVMDVLVVVITSLSRVL